MKNPRHWAGVRSRGDPLCLEASATLEKKASAIRIKFPAPRVPLRRNGNER